MGEFFGSLYCAPFEDLFGLDLAEYLWGPDYTGTMYIKVGFWMLGISLAIAIIYYYILSHPRLGHWWGWLIFLGANAVINFLVGWQMVLKDYDAGLMVDGNGAELPITEDNILCFGVSNMLLSIAAFIIFSLIIKWWSTDCSRSPF